MSNKSSPINKHLTVEQWKELFYLYEHNRELFYETFKKIKGKDFAGNVKRLFLYKFRDYLYHNRDDKILMRKEYMSTKGRPKNNKTKDELIKELIDSLPTEVVEDLIKYGIEQAEKDESNRGEEIKKKIIKSCSLSCRDLASIIGISKSTINRIRNNKCPVIKKENEKLKIAILILKENQYEIGREPIAAKMKKEFGIDISARHCGRLLTNAGYCCTIRRNKYKPNDPKNTNVVIPDIVQRDYDNLWHRETILATDVTYIKCTSDLPHKHLYVSFVVNHRNKSITGWSISSMNNIELVINSFKDVQFKNNIIHSDHGSQYSSNEFRKLVADNSCIQSMSRVGNALDNREVEFVFSIFKTELIRKLDYSKLTFQELKETIQNWIYYYNYKRIQKKLNWEAPLAYN